MLANFSGGCPTLYRRFKGATTGRTSTDEEDDLEENASEEEEETDEQEKEASYPTFEKIVESLKIFYGISEDQNTLLRELRSLKIGRNEKVKDFNIRYRSLFTKLDKKKRRSISILDYTDSLKPNYEAWKRVALKGDTLTLEKAYTLAEKVDRLSNQNRTTGTARDNFTNWQNTPTNPFKIDTQQSTTENEPRQKVKQTTCFYCTEKGHYQSDCPKLKKIIDNNKKNIFEKKPLN